MATLRVTAHQEYNVPQEFQWLEREAPQFHYLPDPPALSPSYAPAHRDDDDDGSSISSRSDSGDSDSDEEDPYHPYNVADASKQWIRQGDFVYAADDLQDNYLSASHSRHEEDAPYVPPTVPDVRTNKAYASFLGPDDLAPSDVCIDPYLFAEPAPRQPVAISPLELTRSLPASPAPSRARTASHVGPSRRSRRTSYQLDTDDEGDVESCANDASEDEYVPSPRVRARKLPRSSPSRASTKSSRHSYSPYPSSSASTSTTESGNRRPGSRNVQIFDQPPPPRGSWNKIGPDAYICPYCGHFQKNKRSPDMERHIRSHFRNANKAQWVCCGVPLEEAAEHQLSSSDHPWTFNGRIMVGGCHEDFSRMDALKRHWKNKNNRCIGDIKYARVEEE